MNEKTSKLLNRYATHTGRQSRELKRNWELLPHARRHVERLRMRGELKKR